MLTWVLHAAIDGMSGIDLMDVLHALIPDDPPPGNPGIRKPDRIPSL